MLHRPKSRGHRSAVSHPTVHPKDGEIVTRVAMTPRRAARAIKHRLSRSRAPRLSPLLYAANPYGGVEVVIGLSCGNYCGCRRRRFHHRLSSTPR